jgi:hypothetical protein
MSLPNLFAVMEGIVASDKREGCGRLPGTRLHEATRRHNEGATWRWFVSSRTKKKNPSSVSGRQGWGHALGCANLGPEPTYRKELIETICPLKPRKNCVCPC